MMNYSFTSLQNKLRFVSLIVLASLICSTQGFATVQNQGAQAQPTIDTPKFQEHKPLTMDSVRDLISKAKEGDIHAQDELMKLHYRGSYTGLLEPEAIGFLTWKGQNLENNIQDRCYQNDFYAYLVIDHFQTIGAQFPKLFETIKERADKGESAAQNNLGLMYRDGKGVKQDDETAFKYFKLAADQGDGSAQYQLARMYFWGKGIKQEDKEAFKYFKLSADQGYPRAQSSLALMYVCGRGIEKVDKEAFKYWKLAATQGLPEAQLNLGNMYANGKGVEQDDREAFKYHKLAADQGDILAQFHLGQSYDKGIGVAKDDKEAFKYYKLAADGGAPFGLAKDELSSMYAEGRGVEKSYIKALYWYIKSKM